MYCPKCNALLSFVVDKSLTQAVIDGECTKTCDACGYKTWVYRGGRVWCLICGDEVFPNDRDRFECKKDKWTFTTEPKNFKPVKKPGAFTKKKRKKQEGLDKYL